MSLERDFEEFAGGPTIATQKRIYVTIRPKGDIYLNSNTHRLLGKPDAVKLFYSRERQTIAVVSANARHAKSFPLFKVETGYAIRAAPFCGHYNIHVGQTERFIDADIDAAGYLILDLRRTVNPTSKKWKSRRQE